MTFREFRALLGCSFSLLAAVVTGNFDAIDAIEARVNAIHAQIGARKAQEA